MRLFKDLTLMCLLCLCASCMQWLLETPTFMLKNVTVTSLGPATIQLTLGIEVYNPNRCSLTLKALDFKLFLTDREIGSGSLTKASVVIPARSSTVLDVSVSAGYRDVSAYLGEALSGATLPYRFEGKAKVEVGPLPATVPFSKEGRIQFGGTGQHGQVLKRLLEGLR